MNDHIGDLIQKRFTEKIKEVKTHSSHRVYLTVEKEDLLAVADYLFREKGARFVIASAVDELNQFEILYHFSFDKEDVMVSLRVRLTRDNPEAPSLSGLIKGAAWIEREMHELFGINFVGHPGLKRLLLPEDWPEKVYPLRKEFFMTEKKEG
ncbi:MAG TPA: NADH-quinone oxidoreductase subunit C [bacterium]|mgnify:CR=1 FL=1|nr:NADH-quinone oxidoreductase subunit C [bacterium]HPP11303.1 NADH-quinone oxidoreductase subunit C [bacterium]